MRTRPHIGQEHLCGVGLEKIPWLWGMMEGDEKGTRQIHGKEAWEDSEWECELNRVNEIHPVAGYNLTLTVF